jgi:hypothetical protein
MASLHNVFLDFVNFGGGSKERKNEMDGKSFLKMTRDCGLLDKASSGLTTTDVDIIFAKAKAKGERRLLFNELYEIALPLLAQKKGWPMQDLVNVICNSSGPVATGTRAGRVELHDNPDLYTGVYAKGGPKAHGGGPRDLSGITDRSPATVRGVNKSWGR